MQKTPLFRFGCPKVQMGNMNAEHIHLPTVDTSALGAKPCTASACSAIEGAGPKGAAMLPAFIGKGAACAPAGGSSTASMILM